MPAGTSWRSCWKGTDGCTDYDVDATVEELVSSVVEFIETDTDLRIRSHHVGQNLNNYIKIINVLTVVSQWEAW